MRRPFRDVLAAEHHHRHAAAGVHRAADEEEIRILRALFRGFEREVLETVADDAVDRTFVGVILLADVERRPAMFEHDVLAQVVQAHPFEFVEHALLEDQVILAGERVCRRRCAGCAAESSDNRSPRARRSGRSWMRRPDRSSDRAATGVCGRRCGNARAGDRRKRNCDGRVADTGSRGRVPAPGRSRTGSYFSSAAHERLVLTQQLFVGRNDFHVRDDDVGGMKRAVLGHEAGDAAALLAHLGDLAVEADLRRRVHPSTAAGRARCCRGRRPHTRGRSGTGWWAGSS